MTESVASMGGLRDLLDQPFGPWSGCWLYIETYDTVSLGRYTAAGDLHLRELRLEDVRELRAFAPEGEIRVWRHGGGFELRHFVDVATEGERSEVQDDLHLLRGSQLTSGAGQGWSRVVDERGARYDVPVVLDSAQLPLRLRVRNRIVSTPGTGVARCTVSRLVDLEDTHGSLIRLWAVP